KHAEMGHSLSYLADPYVGFHIAWAHYRVGNFKTAKELLTKLDAYNYVPNDVLLALIHHRSASQQECRKLLRKSEDWYLNALRSGVVSRSFSPPYDCWQFGMFQLLFREAKTLIEGKTYVEEPLFLLVTGRERALIGFSERAEKDFREAVKIRLEDAEVWAWRGRIFAQLGRHDDAAQELAKAHKFAKGSEQLYKVARMYSFAVGSLTTDKNKPVPSEKKKYEQEWIRQALECLRKAVAAGWK